ncbi:renalase-like [Planococcus citri]|uniref:renalase-like n=1 Tax=Planococcus citri TaxID=170843 RepID=UPI0031F82A8D
MAGTNVAVIGGGITAALIGYLSRHLTVNLDLWESDAQLGGRMKTVKCDRLASYVDIGAQYITTSAETANSSQIYSSLLESCKIKIFTGDIINMRRSSDDAINYVAPEGMDSLAHHFVNLSNFRNIYLSRPIQQLDINQDRVEITDAEGRTEIYHGVILTLPVPVILNLEGNFKKAISGETYEALKKVEYSCRDCLAMFFNDTLPESWAAKYLPDDSVFKYVSIQENKIGSSSNSKSSVVFHSSIQFGQKYKTSSDDITKSILIEHARRLFPTFPDPIEIQHYKWNYSQVLKPYRNSPKSVSVHEKPLIVVAGDAFAASNFDGCVSSAESVADTLKNVFDNKL